MTEITFVKLTEIKTKTDDFARKGYRCVVEPKYVKGKGFGFECTVIKPEEVKKKYSGTSIGFVKD